MGSGMTDGCIWLGSAEYGACCLLAVVVVGGGGTGVGKGKKLAGRGPGLCLRPYTGGGCW